jgi:hypothetical protein
MARLDELVGDAVPSLLKIDTEGAEPYVLRGAEDVLARSAPTLLLEVSTPALARQGLDRDELDRLLKASDYATYSLEPATGRLVATSVGETDGNVLAVHPSRLESIGSLLA